LHERLAGGAWAGQERQGHRRGQEGAEAPPTPGQGRRCRGAAPPPRRARKELGRHRAAAEVEKERGAATPELGRQHTSGLGRPRYGGYVRLMESRKVTKAKGKVGGRDKVGSMGPTIICE
jgi:hypothetical protein